MLLHNCKSWWQTERQTDYTEAELLPFQIHQLPDSWKKTPLATNLCNSLESGLSILENTNNIRAWWEMELVWNCKHECYNQTLGTFFYKIPSKISKWLPSKVLFSTAALESNQKALDLRKQSSSTSTNSNNSRRNSSSKQFLQRSSVRRSPCIWLLVLETALKARSKLHRR